jgi:serine/threonine-protein phosphatase 2A regulatory subunit B
MKHYCVKIAVLNCAVLPQQEMPGDFDYKLTELGCTEELLNSSDEAMDIEIYEDAVANMEMKWYWSNLRRNITTNKMTDLDADVSPGTFTSIEFNQDGELLAVGDVAGEVTILHRNSHYPKKANKTKYTMLTKFDAHDSEFDYLTSGKGKSWVNKLKWLKVKIPKGDLLLSANDKTVKLWKVHEKDSWRLNEYNLKENADNAISWRVYPNKMQPRMTRGTLVVPKVTKKYTSVAASFKKEYKSKSMNSREINSISVSSDQATFLSSDEMKVLLWDIESARGGHAIVDLLQGGELCMQEIRSLNNIISAAEFHPNSGSVFAYGGSDGAIRLCDTRRRPVCTGHDKMYWNRDPSRMNRGFYDEYLDMVRDLRFSPSGRLMLSRDYLSVHVWDLNMEGKPIESYYVQEAMQPLVNTVADLAEERIMSDSFTCNWSGDERGIVTGSYQNIFRVVDRSLGKDYAYGLSRKESLSLAREDPLTCLKKDGMEPALIKNKRKAGWKEKLRKGLDRRVLVNAWHPKENLIAVAVKDELYFYEEDHQFIQI